MLTLAVDTASEAGSIALADQDHVLEEVRLHAPEGSGQVLFGELQALLSRHAVHLEDIQLYAAASGPGSFTGVRIGLAAIKGLAEVAGKPALGISSLEALAEFGSGALRAPVIDAKRGEVFAALFDRAGRELIPASVLTFPAFVDLVGQKTSQLEVEFISAGMDAVSGTVAPRELAGMIARLANRRHRAGELCDPAAMEANYVRRSDAEIYWKP